MPKKSPPSKSEKSSKKPEAATQAGSFREAVESVVIAIILAFLFRAFEAEAFVIPTGSMATTLQGRHKDTTCPECGNAFQTGANLENELKRGPVSIVTCPLCFYANPIDLKKPSHSSHTGDRILVNKFAYEAPFGDPKRWDVVVFKFPGNAKQNYIKRLVGLENETVMVRHGDVYVSPEREPKREDFRIARKPPRKLRAILDPIFDTERLAKSIVDSKWQLNWIERGGTDVWSSEDRGKTYVGQGNDQLAWLNYRQLYTDTRHWNDLRDPAAPDSRFPVLVTDFYTYNHQMIGMTVGSNWVGDLAVEAEVEVETDSGELVLNLVESGRQHKCTFDLATGEVTLSIDNAQGLMFGDGVSIEKSTVTASTRVKGRGRYKLRFANADDQLVLWVGNKPVTFDEPTTYGAGSIRDDLPVVTATDQGDLEPVRIGIKNAKVKLKRIKVLRDIYYTAVNSKRNDFNEYADPRFRESQRLDIFAAPQSFSEVFASRREEVFRQDKDQFFVMGDNSPASKDSRLWSEPKLDGATIGHWVDRDMLIGKAVLIYWPHAIRVGIPGTKFNIPSVPNLPRMGLIR